MYPPTVVQAGLQYKLVKDNDTVYVTLYNNGNCYTRGADSSLHTLLSVWCDTRYTEGTLHPDFELSWREWNTNLDYIKDFHTRLGGIPDEEMATEDYRINREILFHDYMFSSYRNNLISLKAIDFVVRNWIKRFCFMNISAEAVMDTTLEYMNDNPPLMSNNSSVPFGYAAEALSVSFVGYCHTKCISASKCPFHSDIYECVCELVDMLYMYTDNPRVITYNKTNLGKLITGKSNLSWITIFPSTPIEEKMKDALMDAGILTMPQYQALAPVRRYRVDFMIPTPNGGMLAVECDGLQYHANPQTYTKDRQRDNNFLKNGITPVRFSSVDIENDIDGCINTIENIFRGYQSGRQVFYRNNHFGYFDATDRKSVV